MSLVKTIGTKNVNISCSTLLNPLPKTLELSVLVLNYLLDLFPDGNLNVSIIYSISHYIEIHNTQFGVTCDLSNTSLYINSFLLNLDELKIRSDIEKLFVGYTYRYKYYDFFNLKDFQSSKS